MRFMVMHKMTEEMEKGLPPEPAIMEGVGALIADAIKAKVFVSGQGLKPSAQRIHVVFKNGKRTITQGPFVDATDLVGGFAVLRVRSKEEALGWLDKIAAALGDVEMFMGPIVEPWDMGAPKPDDAPLRFLSTYKLDPRSDSDAPPDAARTAKMQALALEMTKAGVLEETAGLAGTKKGARIRFDGGEPRVIDGPFTESKELIAGYAIFDLPSKEAAIVWSTRFGEIVKVNEIEIREIRPS